MKVLVTVTLCFALLLLCDKSFACSDFQVKAKDGTIVTGRSMEFPIDLKSRIWVIPRSANNKYGYLGVDGVGRADLTSDGMNEKGLSVGALMFSEAKYQTPVKGKKSIPLTQICAYLLGNFDNVEDVKKEFNNIRVLAEPVKELGGVLGFHLAIHDAKGHNIVVEFINGETKIYDNPLGVMTNMPEFSWQLTNLSNYINLDAHDKKEISLNGQKVRPAGVGSGFLGMPGDWTPPSRFVRLAWSVTSALPTKNAAGAVILAGHLLNSIDIPMGAIKEANNLYGYAQWVLIKDLSNKVMYYRTYENQTLKSIDLKKLNFNIGAKPKQVSISEGTSLNVDVTGSLL
ncbi:MAG: choloylglycine hydrolase family protein [bacterium]